MPRRCNNFLAPELFDSAFNFKIRRGKYCASHEKSYVSIILPYRQIFYEWCAALHVARVTRLSDDVSSRCLRCQIFEGGVGLAGVGVGGQNPSSRGVYFSLLFPQENFVPPVVNVSPFPKFKPHKWKCFTIPSKVKDFK